MYLEKLFRSPRLYRVVSGVTVSCVSVATSLVRSAAHWMVFAPFYVKTMTKVTIACENLRKAAGSRFAILLLDVSID